MPSKAVSIATARGSQPIENSIVENKQSDGTGTETGEIPSKGLKTSLLHYYSSTGSLPSLKLLIKNDIARTININSTHGPSYETSLMYASYNGHMDVVDYLCDFPVDIYIGNKQGVNATMLACNNGYTNVVERILDCSRTKPKLDYVAANIKRMKNERRNDARVKQMNAGVSERDVEYSDSGEESDEDVEWNESDANFNEDRLLTSVTLNGGSTMLMGACKRGHLDVVRLLIERGNKTVLNKVDGKKESALTIAVANRRHLIATALLSNGADVDSVNNMGRTGLIIACGNGDYDMVEILLKKKCRVNIQTPKGMTALVIAKTRAMTGEEGEDAICKLLREYGALDKGDILKAEVEAEVGKEEVNEESEEERLKREKIEKRRLERKIRIL